MAFTTRKTRFSKGGDGSSFDPFNNQDANASINNLFSGNSMFGAPVFFDSSQASIPLKNHDSLSQNKHPTKFSGPATLTLKLEYDGSQTPFVFKN